MSHITESEAHYQALFKNAPIGLYASSIEGHQLHANRAWAHLNGYATEAEMLAVVNSSESEWDVDPRRRAEFRRILQEQGRVANFESEIYRHRTRERIWISENAILVRDGDGQPLYVQGTVEEITERKQREQEQAYLIAQLAKSVNLKDEFLASMSHALRTPLSSILSITESLQAEHYGPINDRQAQALFDVTSSGHYLLALINDIFDLAKLEIGRIELSFQATDLDSLSQSCLNIVRPLIQQKQLQLSYASSLRPKIAQVDPPRLIQILLNLLTNAVKFTPAGGRVGLEIVGDSAHGTLQFLIWDTGIGIEPAAMEHLFEPFAQLNRRLAPPQFSTGLGLALVYRLVELHGGSIAVESQEGQGSRFTVKIPWIEAKYALVHANDMAAPLLDAPNFSVQKAGDLSALPLILLAEDNHLTVRTISYYLRRCNYRVETAADGIQALAKARQMRPALILMDLQMPGMDGLEATQRIRADATLEDVPIVAFTALTRPGDRERSLAAGVDAYLSKPVNLKRLLRVIEYQLAHRTLL